MRPRDRDRSLAASPVLVGAATVLFTMVAVFLSYNANNGLPFVPTYEVNAKVPDAAELVVGNEVRVGGSRVGTVTDLHADPRRAGHAQTATIRMALDDKQRPIPADTTVRIRQKSDLGLKFVQLDRGRSHTPVQAGGTLGLRSAEPVVDLEDALNAFDRPTRRGLAGAVTELGDGLGARGPALNDAVAALPPLLGHLRPVAANLRDPRTGLHRTLLALRSAAGTIAPVRGQLAGLIEDGAITFRALADVRPALEATLAEAPPTERVADDVLRRATPVLATTARLARELRPGVRSLPVTSVRLRAALRTGTPVLRRVPTLAVRLDDTLTQVRSLAREPALTGSLNRLTEASRTLDPLLAFTLPVQTRCNYFGLFFRRNVTGIIRQGDALGNWFRAGPVLSATQSVQSGRQASDLHLGYYPDQGQNGECETGNEGFVPGRQVGPGVPGVQPGHTDPTAPPAGTPDPPPAPLR